MLWQGACPACLIFFFCLCVKVLQVLILSFLELKVTIKKENNWIREMKAVFLDVFLRFLSENKNTQRSYLIGCGCVSVAVTLQGTWKRKCRSWKPCWRSCRMICKRCLDFREYFPPLRISVWVSSAAEPAGRRVALEGLQEWDDESSLTQSPDSLSSMQLNPCRGI